MKNKKKPRRKGRRTIRSYFEEAKRSDGVAKLAKATVSDWDRQKHPKKASPEEIELVNSIEVDRCPRCGSTDFVCKGKSKSGFKRLLCNNCFRTFSPLTGTLFDSRKIPISEWFEFLTNLCSYESLSQSSLTNMNAQSTGAYWLKKTMAAIESCQSHATLSGRVYIDETYFKSTREGTFLVRGRKPRGLSKNLWCAATARDEDGHCCLIVCGRGKPDSERILSALLPHIAKGSTIIHDGENSHGKLVAALGGAEEIYTTEMTKGLPDKRNPMETINELHRYLKMFMSNHGGYRRQSLQGWLNLFYMVFTSFGNPAEFSMRVIRMMLKCRKIIRYRKAFRKKRR